MVATFMSSTPLTVYIQPNDFGAVVNICHMVVEFTTTVTYAIGAYHH